MKIEVNKTVGVLNNEGVILYPTDTVWGIGCDATNEKAVNKVFNIKQRQESKSLIILVDSSEMLKNYIPSISKNVLELLCSAKKPTSIIYNNPKGLAKNVIADDDTVAIRIPQNEFCKNLIKQFGKPIVSTSANISGKLTPKSFKEIEQPILDSVDYIVNLHREVVNEKSSTIIKIGDNGELIVLRE